METFTTKIFLLCEKNDIFRKVKNIQYFHKSHHLKYVQNRKTKSYHEKFKISAFK